MIANEMIFHRYSKNDFQWIFKRFSFVFLHKAHKQMCQCSSVVYCKVKRTAMNFFVPYVSLSIGFCWGSSKTINFNLMRNDKNWVQEEIDNQWCFHVCVISWSVLSLFYLNTAKYLIMHWLKRHFLENFMMSTNFFPK